MPPCLVFFEPLRDIKAESSLALGSGVSPTILDAQIEFKCLTAPCIAPLVKPQAVLSGVAAPRVEKAAEGDIDAPPTQPFGSFFPPVMIAKEGRPP